MKRYIRAESMKRTYVAELDTRCHSFKTAISRFIKKYPELKGHAEDQFEYMYENNIDHMDNQSYGGQSDWTWAVRFEHEGDWYYFAWIERE